MSYLGYQVVLRLDDSRVIAPDTAARRLVARSVLERAAELRSLAFGLSVTH